MTELEGWAITNLDAPELESVRDGLEVEVGEHSILNEEEAMYWIAPEAYLRDKVRLKNYLVCPSVLFWHLDKLV